MIKCNVTVCGRVSRTAQMRPGKDGKEFLSFGVNVNIPGKEGDSRMIDISVAKDGGTLQEAASFPVGTRVEVAGILTMRKKDDKIYFNMSATGINTFDAGNEDSIKGDIEFRGTIGRNIDTKQDKKGGNYCVFFAYSSEKTGTDDEGKALYEYLWVHFIHFGQSQPDWMQPKSGINAKGELRLSVFRERLDIECRVSELTEWKKDSQPNA